MRAYIVSRSDWKKPENYKQAVDHLEKFIRRDVALTGLTKGDVDRWHRWMVFDNKLSPNTAGQNVKRCRQMMRSALDDGLIESNPFVGVKIDLSSDQTKNRFIDGESALAILASCPDQEWRTIFALARFGGLRCPSELLALRWSDIVWDRGRFKVRSSKTARYGKGERVVPLFPELLAELQSLYDLVEPGVSVPLDAYVIQTYRSTETNLRKALNRIADNAGVPQWPKALHGTASFQANGAREVWEIRQPCLERLVWSFGSDCRNPLLANHGRRFWRGNRFRRPIRR